MLAEISIIPVGATATTGDELLSIMDIVNTSGLPYQVTPAGTRVEGEWGQIMELARQCHTTVREKMPHVVTILKIDDDATGNSALTHPVTLVGGGHNHPVSKEKI